nr:integrase, catalytic region, zinc finger, CCHC-type, peptidase aspartic, catalytic [Tanacetum cinerariifolium]
MASAHNSSDPALTHQEMASVQNSTDLGPTCQTKASVQISSDPAPECQTMALEHKSLSPGRNCQENVSHEDKSGTTLNELDLLFSPMFDELLNGSSKVVSKDGENLDKMKEKGDECIFVGYSTQTRAYRVFNKRTRVIMESIHVNFDELPHQALVHNSSDPALTRQEKASVQNSTDLGPTCQRKASVQISSDPALKCQKMALEHNSLSPGRNCQDNVSHGDKTGTMSIELDLLFSPMFDELLNGSSTVVSKSSAVYVADAPNQRQQPSTPLSNHTTPVPTCQNLPITTAVISSENITQAEPHAENDQVADDEFINIFSNPVYNQGETSSRHVDSSNMHTFY